jgi:hypothetical protein
MEASIKEFLKSALGDYLTGLGQLDRQSLSEPLTLRNVKLKRSAINEDLEATDIPLTVHGGEIGALTFSLNWRGQITFLAENVDATYSMNTLKLAQAASDAFGVPPEQHATEILYDAKLGSERPPFCSEHSTSEQRKKRATADFRECGECHQMMSTNYEHFAVCPPCARETRKCMICGTPVDAAGVVPRPPPLAEVEEVGLPLREGDAAVCLVNGEWLPCTVLVMRPDREEGRFDLAFEDRTQLEEVDAEWVRPVEAHEEDEEEVAEVGQPHLDRPSTPPAVRQAEVMVKEDLRPRGIRGRRKRTLLQLCGLGDFGSWLQVGCFSHPS